MQILKHKKAQAAATIGAIITLIAGVGVAVLVLLFTGSLGGNIYSELETDIAAIGANNATETHTIEFNASQELAHWFIQTDTLTIHDTSNDTALSLTAHFNNLTYGDNGGYSVTLNDTLYGGADIQFSYLWGTADVRASVQDGVLAGFQGLEQTGDFMPIIVLAVIIVLVLTLVLGFTRFGGRGVGGGAL